MDMLIQNCDNELYLPCGKKKEQETRYTQPRKGRRARDKREKGDVLVIKADESKHS